MHHHHHYNNNISSNNNSNNNSSSNNNNQQLRDFFYTQRCPCFDMCVCVRACVRELQYSNHASPCSILLRINFCVCLLLCLIASSARSLVMPHSATISASGDEISTTVI